MTIRCSAVAAAAAVFALAACSAGREAQWEAKPTQKVNPSAQVDAAALMAAAEESWKRRDDQASLEKAIAAWEQLAKITPDDAQVHTRLARAYYVLADGHFRKQGTSSEAYLQAFEKGTAAGERALAASNADFKRQVTSGGAVEQAIRVIGPQSIEPAYWYATNLGKWARAKGFATTLANKDRIYAVMSRLLELDPNFFHGAPHRYLGGYYAVAPGFAGGDMRKSKEHFEKSLAIAPQYIGTKVLMAEVYAVKQQDRALFERLLDEALATADDALPGLEPETRIEKDKAREMKAKASELF
jgi:tetratricopeptide (TPR) repeat protein